MGGWRGRGKDFIHWLGSLCVRDDLCVGNNINAEGYITGKQVGVFAFLSEPTETDTPDADVMVPVAGTFTNAPIKGFSTVATPAIRYDENKKQWFEIDGHITFSSLLPTTTVCVGVKINGVLDTGSVIHAYAQNLNQLYHVSGTIVLELEKDDEVQLVISSSRANNTLTVDGYTTSISEFFD